MTDPTVDDLKCEILLFFATQTEREQLEKGSAEFGIPFDERTDSRIGVYYSLGTIGPNRVRAVRTRMGPFFHQGSASQAIMLRAATSASAIIQLGMAFGIDRKFQKYGDVLVSQWLFPYDYRIVEHIASKADLPERYKLDYRETKRFFPKESLRKLFDRERAKANRKFAVHCGGMLSGGSRIRSQLYLRELLAAVTESDGLGGYVGGEMEGVGLLAASSKSKPVWIVVKGISDFADDRRNSEIDNTRTEACGNAVSFVLAALRGAESIVAE